MKAVFTLLGILLFAVLCSCTHCSTKKMNTKADYILDVRNEEEYTKGHLQDALLIPHTEITQKIQVAIPCKSSAIALYCRSGRRAGIAKEAMERLGYQNVTNLGSMEDASKALNVPIVK